MFAACSSRVCCVRRCRLVRRVRCVRHIRRARHVERVSACSSLLACVRRVLAACAPCVRRVLAVRPARRVCHVRLVRHVRRVPLVGRVQRVRHVFALCSPRAFGATRSACPARLARSTFSACSAACVAACSPHVRRAPLAVVRRARSTFSACARVFSTILLYHWLAAPPPAPVATPNAWAWRLVRAEAQPTSGTARLLKRHGAWMHRASSVIGGPMRSKNASRKGLLLLARRHSS